MITVVLPRGIATVHKGVWKSATAGLADEITAFTEAFSSFWTYVHMFGRDRTYAEQVAVEFDGVVLDANEYEYEKGITY